MECGWDQDLGTKIWQKWVFKRHHYTWILVIRFLTINYLEFFLGGGGNSRVSESIFFLKTFYCQT